MDANAPPGPDAFVAPGTDAYVVLGTDAFVAPGPDAFVESTTDAFLPPGTDAFTLDPDAYIVPPPDAYVPPATDAGPLPDTGGPCAGGPLLTFYRDADGDGRGAAASGTAMRCGPGGGYVASNDDCDDANGARYPGNLEACDGVDNDCDTTVDEAVPASACPFAQGVGACDLGFCVLASCSAGFGNCDGNDTNGCETATTTSPLHCGGCGMACGAADTCVASACSGSQVLEIAAGSRSFCGRRENGRVACWGYGGNLGDGVAREYGVAEVSGITNAVDLAGSSRPGAPAAPDPRFGSGAFCVVTATGGVQCWGGSGYWAAPGLPVIPGGGVAPTPVPVSGLTDAVRVSITESFGCAVRSTGRIACWGSADGGALGNGESSGYRAMPVPVSGITNAVDVFVYSQGACAILSTGAVSCWGSPATGSLTAFSSIGDAASLGAARTDVTSGVLCVARSGADGLVCPIGAAPAISGRVVAAELGAAAVGFGPHACAVTAAGSLFCWGPNSFGQTGHGYTSDLDPIGLVMGLGTTTDVALSHSSTCSLSSTGAVRCWGSNQHREILPTAAAPSMVLTPTVVPGI